MFPNFMLQACVTKRLDIYLSYNSAIVAIIPECHFTPVEFLIAVFHCLFEFSLNSL